MVLQYIIRFISEFPTYSVLRIREIDRRNKYADDVLAWSSFFHKSKSESPSESLLEEALIFLDNRL